MKLWLTGIAVLILASGLGIAPAQDDPPPRDDEPASRPATRPTTRPADRRRPPAEGERTERSGRRMGRGAEGPQSRPASRPVSGPASGPASRPTTRPGRGPASRPASQPTTTQATTKPAKKPDRYFALVGGIVHPAPGVTLHDTDVLCKNGKIQSICRGLPLPEKTESMDVSGLHVYPGLIACASFGIAGTEPPDLSTDVYNTNMVLAAAGGLTTVVTGNTAAKVSVGAIEDHVLRKDLHVSLRYNSPADRRTVREGLERARQYLRDKEAHDARVAAGDKTSQPPKDDAIKGANERWLKLLKKEQVAKVQASDARDLLELADLATEYGLRIVVQGAAEGWIVADRLGRAGVRCIVTPRNVPEADERLNRPNGGSAENAAALYRGGVEVAVVPSSTATSLGGLAGRDLINLPMEAAYAARGGLPESAAVASITIAAARALGVDDRVGTIEVGKDADMIVCDGELLDFFTTVQWTIVNGRVAYDKSKETLYGHVRPRSPSTQPAPYKFWPRPWRPQASDGE